MPEKTLSATRALIDGYFQQYPGEAAKLIETLPTKEIQEYLQQIPYAVAAEVLTRLNPDAAEKLLEKMPDELFQALFKILDPAYAARLLGRVAKIHPETVTHKLSLLPSNLAEELQDLMTYPPETAGYLMDPRVMTFRPDETVENTLERMRNVRRRRIVDICIVDDEGRLTALIPLQKVAVGHPFERLAELIADPPVSIHEMAPQDEVIEVLDKHKLASLPVIDIQGKLVGVIRYDTLVTAAKQNASEDLQAMFGAGRDERALSKASFAIGKRLPWLEINLATAFLASAVVGMFEDTIARITALAVFLPVVAGQSGNTGSQALAVTMRGLALREIRTRHWFQVVRKEVAVGFVNGCAVALTTALIVYFWESSFGLAIVIGTSMVISMVIAGLSGAVIPIILRAVGQDPAQSSSIILTTVTDVVGFMSFLGLATVLAATLNIV